MSMEGNAGTATARRGPHTVRWVVLGVAAAVLLPGLVLLGTRLDKDATLVPSALMGKQAPAFAWPTLDGRTITNADLEGKPYVVNFWASWCGPCREEHGALRGFWERYRHQGVQLLGVLYEDSPAAARAFQQELGGDWPILQDPQRRFVDFGVRGPPETFVVNSQGVIVAKFTGALRPGQLEQVVATADAALAGR